MCYICKTLVKTASSLVNKQNYVGTKEYPLKSFSFYDESEYMIIGYDYQENCCSLNVDFTNDSDLIKKNKDAFYINRADYNDTYKTIFKEYRLYRDGRQIGEFYWYGEEINYGTLTFEKINGLQKDLVFGEKVDGNTYYSIIAMPHHGEVIYELFVHGEDQKDLCTVMYVISVDELNKLGISCNEEIVRIEVFDKEGKTETIFEYQIEKQELYQKSY